MGVAWQNTAYNQPPHLGYYLPDALRPCLLDKQREWTVDTETPFEYLLKGRYTKTWPTVNTIQDNGSTSTTMPAGIKRTTDYTNKTVTLSGIFEKVGDYKFLVTLTGLGGETVYDTLTVHVITPASIVDIASQNRFENGADATYDLQGRHYPSVRHGLYIVRKNGKAMKVIR